MVPVTGFGDGEALDGTGTRRRRRRHGVHTSVLFRWRRRHRAPADADAGFVPVVVEAPEPSSEAAPGRMEIVVGDDVRVIVDATVHAGALARVLAVVTRR